jgi:phospholipase C
MPLSAIEHIVVVMFENRSLDTMLGSLYSGGAAPSVALPKGTPLTFNGITPDLSNPTNPQYVNGGAANPVPVRNSVTSSTVPDPDPEETFVNVTAQIFGPGQSASANPTWPMQGFAVNYALTKAGDATQVLQCHSPTQLPILSALARAYAVSDAWFASVPSQTWPNRAFVHAGTSNGRVDNGSPPDPVKWDVTTIFNVLESVNASWGVYCDTILTPSLTRTMFPKLWDPLLDGHFHGFTEFVDACAANSLPRYSFIEPSFMLDPNDQHPPHDVLAGEAFLHAIWTAVSTSPGWAQTLLLVTFDEHGGCFDHVLPPGNATPPDQGSKPGDNGFGFDRFGIRVPAVVISPYIAPGTVFRSDSTANAPYDHTSILATLRDWLSIDAAHMLPSLRARAAPTLAQLLTLATARTDLPAIAAPSTAPISTTSLSLPPNDLQKSLVAGSARRFGLDPAMALAQIQTRQHAVDFFKRRASRAHL